MPTPFLRPVFLAILCLGLLPLSAQNASALPIIVEARVTSTQGDPRRAAQEAVHAALSGAVEEVLRRHVAPDEWESWGDQLRRNFLKRPDSFVTRYSIVKERWEDLAAVVEVHADVDEPHLLEELATRGVPIHLLKVRPRVFLAASADPSVQFAMETVKNTLEQSGYQLCFSSADVADPMDEVELSEWTRNAGCHFGVLVELAEGSETSDAESAEQSAVSDVVLADRWLDPSGEPSTRKIELDAWLVDAIALEVLGHADAMAVGFGEGSPAAAADAARRGATRLAYQILRLLEQSEWSPSAETMEAQAVVRDLPDPLALEEVRAALVDVAEIRSVQLREVQPGKAMWDLVISDSGLEWTSALKTAHLSRGTLVWEDHAGMAEDTPSQRVEARWTR